MTGRRKRPHVPEESRKRVARACDACRRLKEKCEGGFPCTRCTRLQRACEFVDASKTLAASPRPELKRSADDVFYDKARIEALETLVKHYTKLKRLDTPSLRQKVQSLDELVQRTNDARRLADESLGDDEGSINHDEEFTIDPVNSTTAVYDGGLSHCEFSHRIHRKLNAGRRSLDAQHDGQTVPQDTGINRASRLHADASTILKAALAFPPPEVANFLIEIFFEYAQTNYFYGDEPSLRQKLDVFYSYTKLLGSGDASWLCTLLMVFAMATQFAHLSSSEKHNSNARAGETDSSTILSPDDDAALTFYRTAITLIPGVISLASIESVQAFLLLGTYTLPIDTGGLSFTYCGIAMKMAIQNGMHRKLQRGMDARTIELRNRIWWSTCILEKRVCVMHGRPVSLLRSQIDTALPAEFPALMAAGRIDTLPNILAMIELTKILEDARDRIFQMRKISKTPAIVNLDSILQIQQSLRDYWETLPTKTYCRDLTPSGHLFRSNIHLAMVYDLAHVFIGRNFIFLSHHGKDILTSSPSASSQWQERTDMLIDGCVESAIRIIELCQILQDESGLARASYTEFSSCRAALLVILAQRMYKQNTRLSNTSQQGMELLKHMSLGLYAADAEKSAIAAMETAIQRLNNEGRDFASIKSGSINTAESAYDRFRNWAMLWKVKAPGGPEVPPSQDSVGTELDYSATVDLTSNLTLSPMQNVGWDMYSPSFLFEMDDNMAFTQSEEE